MIRAEVMDESLVNTIDDVTVIIPTAGLGSRMGNLTEFLNKALLPYKNKPVLSHIIDQFPLHTKFIIPVGYKSEQVIDFCNLVYPERDIEFIHIPNYTESYTGPGYTMKYCLDAINSPFYYIPCDTYFDKTFDNNYDTDVYFVKHVGQENNFHYTTFLVENNLIQDYKFKEHTDNNWVAFTGVMYIKNFAKFKQRLKNLETPEIIDTIPKQSNILDLDSWIDFGNLEIYNSEQNKLGYDFSKTDEITYICNNKVVKYWKKAGIASKKYEKSQSNTAVYPDNVKYTNNWLSYDYFTGTTFYEHNDKSSFDSLLEWLDKDVWIHSDTNLQKESHTFYKTKTLERINLFLQKYKDLPTITHINGIEVKPYRYYIDNIDYDLLCNEVLSGYTHGDLQFDNIIISENSYKVIDWRQEFGGNILYGDIYYDLAKMYGGLIIDYSKVKQNQFGIKQEGTSVYLDIPYTDDFEYYQTKIVEYIKNKGYNINKVKMLIPVIYWNMSPLHTAPFDMFLWYLGILMFQNLENEKLLQHQ